MRRERGREGEERRGEERRGEKRRGEDRRGERRESTLIGGFLEMWVMRKFIAISSQFILLSTISLIF